MSFDYINVLVAVSTEDIGKRVSACLQKAGISKIITAYTMYQAVALMHDNEFNMFVVDGRLLVSSNQDKIRVAGVDFVRFVRMCEGPVSEAHILFLRSENHPEGLIAANSEFMEAREGGASSVMAQPLTGEKFERHVAPNLENPRLFIRERNYLGPCRRRVDLPVKIDRRKTAPSV
jgi:two-component system chemotaxis response regulator CheY